MNTISAVTDLFNPLRYWTDDPRDMPELDAEDAALDREDSLSERNAFLLGEEMGIYRLSAPDVWTHEAMERGYVHGLSRQARHGDLYMRKLLAVRSNAFARGIPVSSALTIEYLKEITVTICPISGVELTQGMQQPTDWSIDRLDNELGYVPGNVCFMSTRANQLKGTVTFETAIDAASAFVQEHGLQGYLMDIGNGLKAVEAWRLAALMAGPSGYAKQKFGNFPPMAMAPRVWSSVQARIAGIHMGCARTRTEGIPHRKRVELFKHLGKDLWRMSGKLVESVGFCLRQGVHPCDAWLDPEISLPMMEITRAFMLSPPPSALSISDAEVTSRTIAKFVPVSQYERRR